jgi:nitrite reductase/ring-hydroxylating ferredoxin subunit
MPAAVKHRVFRVEELAPGGRRHVQIGSVGVMVTRLPGGEFRALRDRCPHLGAALSLGKVQTMSVATDFREPTLSDRVVVRCPWHGYEFDTETGKCPADEHLRVRTYTVWVEDGWVVVER